MAFAIAASSVATLIDYLSHFVAGNPQLVLLFSCGELEQTCHISQVFVVGEKVMMPLLASERVPYACRNCDQEVGLSAKSELYLKNRWGYKHNSVETWKVKDIYLQMLTTIRAASEVYRPRQKE